MMRERVNEKGVRGCFSTALTHTTSPGDGGVQPSWWSKAVQLAVRVKAVTEDLPATMIFRCSVDAVACGQWRLQAVAAQDSLL